METASASSKLKLDEFLRVVDAATAIRKKEDEVSRQLDINEAKAELKRRITETAKATGERLSDFQIETAVDNYFQGLYSFNEPKRDFGTRLAEAYVDRARLFKKFVVLPAAVAACAGLVIAAASGITTAALNAKERGIEKRVETAYQERQSLTSQALEVTSSSLAEESLPSREIDQLQNQLVGFTSRLDWTNPFFDKYCSGGTAEDDVTQANLVDVENALPSVSTAIKEASSYLAASREILKTQEGLTTVKRNLDSFMGEIRTTSPLEAFTKKAEAIYTSGISEVERRNLEAAEQKNQELHGVRTDITKYSGLVEQTEKLFSGIKAVAKEPEALQRGEGLYKEARDFAQAADVSKLSGAVAQMQSLDQVLNQEYTLKIVTREGVKSGIDRYYTDSQGKRSSGFYLIVEAIDGSGNALPLDITSEENGQVRRVTMWGERVPNEVYERVKADKMDNGIVNDTVVGTKQRGYAKEKITMTGVTKQGQITEW